MIFKGVNDEPTVTIQESIGIVNISSCGLLPFRRDRLSYGGRTTTSKIVPEIEITSVLYRVTPGSDNDNVIYDSAYSASFDSAYCEAAGDHTIPHETAYYECISTHYVLGPTGYYPNPQYFNTSSGQYKVSF